MIAVKPGGERDASAYSSRLIGLAMLVGVAVAMAATPGKARDAVKVFFEGAGHGFATIVSLIVTATCFGKAVEGAGLAAALGRLIADAPGLLQPLAAAVPLAFAALTGSGMASTQSLYGFFHGPAEAHGHDPTAVGALVAVGSAAGRTMSPVAAVTLAQTAIGRHLKDALVISFLKTVVHPLLMWAAGWALGLSGLPLKVMVVAAALPVGANVFLFSQRYHKEEDLVTASVAVSTVMAVGTVSVVMGLLR